MTASPGSWKGVLVGGGDSFTQNFGQYKVPLVVLLGIISHRFADRGKAGGFIPQKLATEMETYGQPIICGRSTR
jgi:hypothetical protein